MKKTFKKSRRRRIRSPALIDAFCGRFRQAITETRITQAQLAETFGGFSAQMVSRIAHGDAKSVPIDFLVRLSEWADQSGISLRWLLLGMGSMRKRDVKKQPELIGQINEALAYRLALTLAERAAVDLSDILEDSEVAVYVPDWGVITLPLEQILKQIEEQIGPPKSAIEPGYRTVPPEDVPTSPDWYKRYVPIIGRVAAGEGVDVAEVAEYPPSWAGDFVIYEGAPRSAVAVRVVGPSMESEYKDGDMIIVDRARAAESGDVCCVILDRDGMQEARLKKLKLSGNYAILESLNRNPKFNAERFAAKHIIAAYRILAHLPLLWRRPTT